MSASPATYPARVTWPVVVVVAAIMTLLIGSPFDDEPDDVVQVGQRVAGQVTTEDEPAADELRWAALPYGAVRFAITTGNSVRTGGDEHRTEGDARFVTVTWTPKVYSNVPPLDGWPTKDVRHREPGSKVVLIAEGERHVLREGLRSSTGPGSATVVVKRARGLKVQVVTGERRSVAHRTEPGPGGTSDGSTECTRGRVECRLEVTRGSYVTGLGMAPDGKDWLVVNAAIDEPGGDPHGAQVVRRGFARPDGGPAYVATGKPTLSVRVVGADDPVRTSGSARLSTREPRLETRAYLVPSTKSAEVVLTYQTAAVPEPGSAGSADAAQRIHVSGDLEVGVVPSIYVAPSQ